MQVATYDIEFEGTIPPAAREEFADFALHEEHGRCRLTGNVGDQAALHGMLARLNALGLRLVAVSLTAADHREARVRTG